MPTNIKAGVLTIKVPARLDDGNLSEFYVKVSAALKNPGIQIKLDCSALAHVTSSHIMTIFQVANQCRDKAIQVSLVSLTESLRDALKVLDLYDVLVGKDQNDGDSKQAESEASYHKYPARLELAYRPDNAEIENCQEKIEGFLKEYELPGKICFEVTLVFYEVSTNIRLHGNLSETDTIEFGVEINKDDLTLRFADPGKPFNPGANVPNYDPLLSLESEQRQGLGLVLINRIMDTMDYSRDKGARNILVLSKKLVKGGVDNDH